MQIPYHESERAALLKRAALFERLSALWCQPEQDVHCSKIFVDETCQMAVEISKTVEKYALLLSESVNDNCTALLIDYARLMIGPDKVPALPYASVYLGTKQLNNEVTDWVKQFYLNAGLGFDPKSADLPDHFAVELDFMFYLFVQRHNALIEMDQAKYEHFTLLVQEFWHGHLIQWAHLFCEAIEEHANHVFYKNLAPFSIKLLYEVMRH